MASAFAGFFDRTPPIIREQDPAVRQFRLALVSSFRQVMKNTLDVLGIKPLDRI
ncbi:MAG: hypothetical protein LC772_01815 [Chloroflexi bacterium]|nr:hypothetical protein [Chloroflexota bacterium]